MSVLGLITINMQRAAQNRNFNFAGLCWNTKYKWESELKCVHHAEDNRGQGKGTASRSWQHPKLQATQSSASHLHHFPLGDPRSFKCPILEGEPANNRSMGLKPGGMFSPQLVLPVWWKRWSHIYRRFGLGTRLTGRSSHKMTQREWLATDNNQRGWIQLYHSHQICIGSCDLWITLKRCHWILDCLFPGSLCVEDPTWAWW